MGHEIHITRGERFGDAGSNPITAQQWQDLASSTTEIEQSAGAGNFARLHGRPLVFNQGLIAAASAQRESFETLRKIAARLDARLFGEDGVELGLSAATEVRTTFATAFASPDASALADADALNLVILADISSPPETRRTAAESTTQLQGDAAKVALGYLICRAIEASGKPSATLTTVCAHLLRWDPARIDSFRIKHPTKAWVKELETLAKQVDKKPGLYVLRKCHECKATNRIALLSQKQPKCGRCKTLLAMVEG